MLLILNNDYNMRPYPITIKPIKPIYNETSIHIPLEENFKKNHLGQHLSKYLVNYHL